MAGDLRSTGDVATVLRRIERDPSLVAEIAGALPTTNPALNMRLMDVIEKHARSHPEAYERYADFFLDRLGPSQQKEIRWHIAQILRHVRLSKEQTARALALMTSYLSDRSRIVQAEAAETYYPLAPDKARALRRLEARVRGAAPALKARLKRIAKD
jgi:hypothetical protein